MKILLIHTFYQLAGGEDAVFEGEYRLLAKNHEVHKQVFRNHNGLKGAWQFFGSFWNARAKETLKKRMRIVHPDVVHIHNWHYAAGPVIIRAAKELGIPVVLTLHNYRLLCPSATLLMNGKLFTDSLHASFPWAAIRKKAYRHSALQTFWLALIIWVHKKTGTWAMVDKYVVLTDFAKSLFKRSVFGIPEERFTVKPNFTPPVAGNTLNRGNHFLFIGRLSEEKGIRVLLETFGDIDIPLSIAGNGPLEAEVLESCKLHKHINYLGRLNKEGVQAALQHCTALLFPSIWYEGMPMTLLEAFACGTPVIGSNIGAMQSMISHGYNGLLFEPGDAGSLKQQLGYWQSLSDGEKRVYQENACKTYQENYTPEKNEEWLKAAYYSVIEKQPVTKNRINANT